MNSLQNPVSVADNGPTTGITLNRIPVTIPERRALSRTDQILNNLLSTAFLFTSPRGENGADQPQQLHAPCGGAQTSRDLPERALLHVSHSRNAGVWAPEHSLPIRRSTHRKVTSLCDVRESFPSCTQETLCLSSPPSSQAEEGERRIVRGLAAHTQSSGSLCRIKSPNFNAQMLETAYRSPSNSTSEVSRGE